MPLLLQETIHKGHLHPSVAQIEEKKSRRTYTVSTWHALHKWSGHYELAHEKRGLTAFSVIVRKSQSKIVVQNFTILQVCDFVLESYGAAHALPCFIEVNGKLKFQEFFCSLLEQNRMNDREVTAG